MAAKLMKVDEAAPAAVKPPSAEPALRVGIILEEDAKQQVTFTCPGQARLRRSDGVEFELESGRRYTAVVESGACRMRGGPAELDLGGAAFTVREGHETEVAPGSGIKVEHIVAGRGFHWQKEISQTLPGTLEFLPLPDRIVLINTIGLEFYVKCVLASEMSGRECPPAFAKAQATAARSWARVFLGSKYPGKPYQLCNDDFSQRYQGTTHLSRYAIEAVEECRGDYLLTAAGDVCPAYYSKSCGGHGESIRNLFGFDAPGVDASWDAADPCAFDLSGESDFARWLAAGRERFFCGRVDERSLPRYLGAVDESGCYFRWEHATPAQTIARKLSERCGLEGVRAIRALVPGRRGVSGRVLTLTVEYLDARGRLQEIVLGDQFYIRACLHDSFLYSSAFLMSTESDGEGSVREVHFSGAGWGHGGGLCQIGALGMALAGHEYAEILQHYFPSAVLTKSY